MPLTMRADSTEYATATVSADHDITADTIQVALPTAGVAPSTWYPAQVLSVVPSAGNTRWTATYRILLGPVGGVTQLTPGTYDWTVKITDSPGPEVPIRKVSLLTITAT